MTFEQKLKQEKPNGIADVTHARYCGCPSTFGYEPEEDGLCGGDRYKVTDETCKKCWSREITKKNGKRVWMTGWKSS